MNTKDLFKINRSAKKINESIEKVFGKKLNLESFDLDQLQDARNKIRTQLSQQRGSSGFNENIENDAYTKAQWMLDAINAEISHREEFIVDEATGDTAFDSMMKKVTKAPNAKQRNAERIRQKKERQEDSRNRVGNAFGPSPADKLGIRSKGVSEVLSPQQKQAHQANLDSAQREMDRREAEGEDMTGAKIDQKTYKIIKPNQSGVAEADRVDIPKPRGPNESDPWRQGWVAWFDRNSDNPYEKGTAEYKRWEDGFYDAEAQPNFYESKDSYKEEFEFKSTNKGNEMTRLRESEIDQASAIVTANTMVDRLGRWIEELSGMENETLLQLGDSIRDEMGQEQSRQFIEAVAPTMQSALETLKSARESVSGAVRNLATGESPDAMLGAPDDSGMDSEMDMSDPDAMNAGDLDIGPEEPIDDFDAAEPAAGGIETAGRAKRESIDFQNRLLKVLAG
jgi:hypothetical protein